MVPWVKVSAGKLNDLSSTLEPHGRRQQLSKVSLSLPTPSLPPSFYIPLSLSLCMSHTHTHAHTSTKINKKHVIEKESVIVDV